ncbi:MAG TPA: sensor histidine kinase [Micromonosporaceae bacterium]
MSPYRSGRRLLHDFAHAALIVDSDETLVSGLVPLLRRSLDNREPVLMVVGKQAERVVRRELGELSDRLEWKDQSAFYQRLGSAYEGFRRYLAEQHAAGRRVHVVAEPDVATESGPVPVDRVTAYLSYEAMCNEAYAEYGCPVTCLWDSRRHPALVIEGVRSVHSQELTAAGKIRNPGYVTPQDYLVARSDVPLEPPPPTVDVDRQFTNAGQLALLRAAVQTWAEDRSFAAAATDDVVLAVTEVATNGLVHGAPPVRVRAWHHADILIVQVDDSRGRRLPPAAGYRRPSLGPEGGRGLWLARQLADTVTAHTGNGCTSVRLHFPYDVTHRRPAS